MPLRPVLLLLLAQLCGSTASVLPAPNTTYDVVVIGAGYAGLTCARRLAQAGASVRVLEALDRAGGRAYDYTFPPSGPHAGHVLEQGVAFIGDEKEMPHANRLIVDELRFRTYSFPVWGPGNCTGSGLLHKTCRTALLCKNGRGQIHNFTTLFPGTISKRCVGSLVAVAELVAVTAELIAMSASLDPARPWAHPLAAQWDATTFGAWLRRRLPTPEAYRYMCLTVEPDLSQSVDAVSLLHAVFLAKTGGGVGPGLYAFNQGYRIVGGGAAPAAYMAQALGPAVVRYGTRVRRVVQSAGGVRVETAGGAVLHARYIVATGAPSVVGRLEFDPPLPEQKRRLAERVPMGNAVRMSVVYPEPFWRAMGLSGSHGDEGAGVLLPLGYDASPCNNAGSDSDPPSCRGVPGVIQVETTGNATTQLMAMAPEQRLRYFAEYLSQYYGPRALSPEALVGFDFGTEPTLGGGAQAHFPPGAWTALGPALRAPFGRVHFAGTEYAAVGFGYVEGAIQSGNATALELLRRLRP